MKQSEIEIVREIRSRFPFPENLGIGIGDDAALLRLKKPAVLTTDLMIEEVHFDLKYTSFYHLGFKIVSVNVSDIYAMGGDFRGFLFSVGLPQSISDEELKELFDGINEALNYYDGYLLGGDLSKSEKVVLSGFAIGETDKPILRKGAEPDDIVFITSYTGLSSAGLNFLKNLSHDERKSIKTVKNLENFKLYNEIFRVNINELLERHLMPKARKPDKFRNLAKAMMDISDGLLIDLHRLCEENEVGAEIYLQKIPIHPAVLKIAEYLNIDPMRLILSGGEDYELLVISNQDDITALGLIPIGKIVKGRGIYLIDPLKGK
ncbi:MAG: thiamine-phosphate kinase, partial [Thermodesulfovibrio sp.]|nr:thiamine-phosphate kinase [Thermodesulfovibrio sp.]